MAKSIGGFKYDPSRSSFKNWLLTVARHRITDYIRRRPKEVGVPPRRARDSTRTSTVARVPDPARPALEVIEEAESEQALKDEAMERLKAGVSAEHFRIFYLSVIKEQPAAKVAAALGVKVAKVYVVRHRLAPRSRSSWRRSRRHSADAGRAARPTPASGSGITAPPARRAAALRSE